MKAWNCVKTALKILKLLQQNARIPMTELA
ncbi:MAG: AsnC family protein, partial [Neisseria subflava]|nr:AsnC family protein [Neisseria subflava]